MKMFLKCIFFTIHRQVTGGIPEEISGRTFKLTPGRITDGTFEEIPGLFSEGILIGIKEIPGRFYIEIPSRILEGTP